MVRKKIKMARRVSGSGLFLVFAYICLLIFPSPLFSYKVEHGQCTVYADRPIDQNIHSILEDALSRISKSDLYRPEIHYNIFICNNLLRFKVFTQGNGQAGAVTHYHLTGNIFIRPCDIPNNRIIAPKEWYFANQPFSFSDRPLSYYLAHEMTHVLEARFTGAFDFGNPAWLTEGYADYIGKAGQFDFDENLRLLKAGAPELDPSKGLYRYYHLEVAYLLDYKGWKIKDLYEHIPDEKQILEVLAPSGQ